MTIHVFSSQPLISEIIVHICQKAHSKVLHTKCEKFKDVTSRIKTTDVVVLVESKTNLISADAVSRLRLKTKKIVLVKNPLSKLNVRSLYFEGNKNIITTEDSENLIQQSIVAAIENKPYLSSSILSEIGVPEEKQTKNLSSDEIIIIKMSWAEKRNKEIADSLCLSVRTIENKRIRIKEKFAVASFTGVFKKAILDGLISI